MQRYRFENAGSNLKDQMAFLRGVKRLKRRDLETFTEGLSIPDAISIGDPLFYKCWAGCTRGMIRAALGQPVRKEERGVKWKL